MLYRTLLGMRHAPSPVEPGPRRAAPLPPTSSTPPPPPARRQFYALAPLSALIDLFRLGGPKDLHGRGWLILFQLLGIAAKASGLPRVWCARVRAFACLCVRVYVHVRARVWALSVGRAFAGANESRGELSSCTLLTCRLPGPSLPGRCTSPLQQVGGRAGTGALKATARVCAVHSCEMWQAWPKQVLGNLRTVATWTCCICSHAASAPLTEPRPCSRPPAPGEGPRSFGGAAPPAPAPPSGYARVDDPFAAAPVSSYSIHQPHPPLPTSSPAMQRQPPAQPQQQPAPAPVQQQQAAAPAPQQQPPQQQAVPPAPAPELL